MDILEKLSDRILRRLGYPTVEVYTDIESVKVFLEEAVEKMAPYCAVGNRKAGYFQLLANGECSFPHNTSNIINVYPDKPATVMDPIQDQFYGLLFRDDTLFSWTYGANGKIYCKTLRNQVWIEWYDYSSVCYDNLTEFFKDLAYRWALALTKESEANIRGKYNMSGSPFETNASDLRSEADSEKSAILDTLSSQPLMKAVTVSSF